MVNIEEIKKKRFDFLYALYDVTDANTLDGMCRTWDIGEKLGFDSGDTEKIAKYLHDEGLIKILHKDRNIVITNSGIREVERAVSEPNKPTEHFPALNIIHVEKMDHSQITQASSGVTQVILSTEEDRRSIEEDLALLKESIHQLGLPPEQESDLRAEVGTIEAQMKSSKPKWVVIKGSFGSIKEILQAAAAVATTAHGALQLLSMLHH
jgi:hypothetical protein